MTIYNFILYKCGRSTELQKFETLKQNLKFAKSETLVCIFSNLTHNIPWGQVFYIFQYTFWVAINAIWWSNFWCAILFEISFLLKRNKMKNASISSPHLFLLLSANWLPQILHKATSIIPEKAKNRNLT